MSFHICDDMWNYGIEQPSINSKEYESICINNLYIMTSPEDCTEFWKRNIVPERVLCCLYYRMAILQLHKIKQQCYKIIIYFSNSTLLVVLVQSFFLKQLCRYCTCKIHYIHMCIYCIYYNRHIFIEMYREIEDGMKEPRYMQL